MLEIKFAENNEFINYREFDPHSKYINPEKILNKIKNQEIIIAKDKDLILGLIRFNYIWSTRPYLEFIFIDETIRNQGIAKKMLDFLEKYLKENEYSFLISSAEESDINAINWHLKNDFKEIGKLKDLNLPFDNSSEIFFTKKISDFNKLREYDLV